MLTLVTLLTHFVNLTTIFVLGLLRAFGSKGSEPLELLTYTLRFRSGLVDEDAGERKIAIAQLPGAFIMRACHSPHFLQTLFRQRV